MSARARPGRGRARPAVRAVLFGSAGRPIAGIEAGAAVRHATSVAQLVEHRSPKPAVGGSIPSARARSRRPDGRLGDVPCEPRGIGRRASRPASIGRPPATDPRSTDVPVPVREARRVSWAKSKTECRRRSRRSPPRGGPAGGPSAQLCPVPGEPGAGRPLQADAGLVRPALHGGRPGRGRRRWGSGGSTRRLDRVLARRSGSASRRRSALVLGWLIFRLVQFPPFAEFLIATEAEMNKVSWTSRTT